MFSARDSVGTRLTRQSWRWLWAFILLLPLVNWLPVRAQTVIPNIVPDTVVLPKLHVHLPLVIGEATNVESCPQTSNNVYEAQPVLGEPRDADYPPRLDPDINLLIRGYKEITSTLQLIAINGPTDDDAPQLAHLFRPVRVPTFSAVYQVYDWNWACCPGGEVGEPMTEPEVTLVEMVTTPGEAIYPPRRNAPIGRDFIAMVLYAEEYRITFTYTREDTPAIGYLVHLENVCVDPNLLALYQELHFEGREDLPALGRNDMIGIAPSPSLLVAVRDTGSFMDPRSGKDWWQETVRAMLAARQ